jgi:hypothetical protein
MEMSGQFQAQARFIPAKKPPIPTGNEIGRAQKLSGRREDEKNLLPLAGIELRFLGCQVCSQSIYRLKYSGSA